MRAIIVLICVAVAATAEAESSLNAHRDNGLNNEAAAVTRFTLTRFDDQKVLERAIKQHLVVRVPDSGRGFALRADIGNHASANRAYYRYARPYTRRFIERLGAQYRERGGGKFVITSLVRTCKYQVLMSRGNPNAASCEKTSHTAGTTVDILVGSIDRKHRQWFRSVLLSLEEQGLILATEEHAQPVFHVMVLPPYQNHNPKTPRPRVARK